MASIFLPQRWEWRNLCDNRSSVSNSHVKPVRFILSERHFWKAFSGSIPELQRWMVLKVTMAIISEFFSILLFKTLILFITFNKWRKQNIILDGTMDRNTTPDKEGKKKVNLEILVNKMPGHEWGQVRSATRTKMFVWPVLSWTRLTALRLGNV